MGDASFSWRRCAVGEVEAELGRRKISKVCAGRVKEVTNECFVAYPV